MGSPVDKFSGLFGLGSAYDPLTVSNQTGGGYAAQAVSNAARQMGKTQLTGLGVYPPSFGTRYNSGLRCGLMSLYTQHFLTLMPSQFTFFDIGVCDFAYRGDIR